MKNDVLYNCFIKRLTEFDDRNEKSEELVQKVVVDYFLHLMEVGHIPQNMLDSVEELLVEEVWEMYRKKTYGSASVANYRKQIAAPPEDDTQNKQGRKSRAS
jgi:hypothetical protein